MSNQNHLVRGIKATFVSRFADIVANGLLIILLSRFLLGPDGYGLLFLTLSILAIAQLVANLGIARSAGRYISEYKENESGQIPHILVFSLQYKLVLIIFVTAGLVIGRDVAAMILDEPALSGLLLIGCLFIATQSLKNYTVTVFQGFNVVENSAIISIVDYIGRLVFIIGFVVVGWGVAGALVGYVVSGLISSVLGFYLLYFGYYRQYQAASQPEVGLRRRILEYSIPLTASESANVIDRRVDLILIGFFLNPVAVGLYTVAKQISEFVVAPAGSVGFALSPTYGEQKANDGLQRAARIYETSLQYVFLIYVPAAVGMVLVADPAVTIVFGGEYAEIAPVVQVLSIYVLFQAVTNVTTQALDYLGRARHRAIAKMTTAVANLLLNIILIPTLGIVGAAIATVITFGIYTLANVYVMHVELPIQYNQLLRVGGGVSLISVFMGVVVIATADYITGPLSLLTVVALAIVVWGTLVTISGLVDVRETATLLS